MAQTWRERARVSPFHTPAAPFISIGAALCYHAPAPHDTGGTLDTRTKVCPDCAQEGDADPQPADAFYHVKSPRNATGYRLSAYCKRHTKASNARAAREAPAGSGIRASRERARAAWRTRNPDKWKAIRRSWARRHTQATAATYSEWVTANKARRKASQQAWYRRRKQRTPEQ